MINKIWQIKCPNNKTYQNIRICYEIIEIKVLERKFPNKFSILIFFKNKLK